jgi:DNA-binding NarL/FixJ family response regulator
MRQVIYFDKNDKNYNRENLSSVGEFTNSKIDVVNSWSELMGLLATRTETGFVLALFNQDLLDLPGTTLNEIVSAMNTVSSLTGHTSRIGVGVVINEKCDQKFIQHLKRSGVNGIVPNLNAFSKADFYEAVDILLVGSTHWPESCIQSKPKSSYRKPNEYGIRLTDRQREIMALVANRGLSNKKIAQILNISESTVKVHVSSILKAYGVRNRTQLALAGNRGLHA